MPRADDFELLAMALLVGGLVAALVRRPGSRGSIGAAAVAVALVGAVGADRWFVHEVPRDLPAGAGQLVLTVAVATMVGWGSTRLAAPASPGLSPVLPFALVSTAGVWAGVPETSAAILTGGVLVAVGAASMVQARALTVGAGVVMSIAPVVAAYIGAAGEWHALVGGVLCSTTLALLVFRPRLGPATGAALAGAVGIHLLMVIVAARLVGVSREWSGAPLWVVWAVGLAAAATATLHQGLGRPAS